MRAITTTALVLLTLAAPVVGLLYVVPAVNAWELANNYPYGKMCNSIFTANVDTCPR
jgi:hypothetical protein